MSYLFDVVCVGSCSIDFISYVPRLPKPGETLRASKYQTGFGGKGGNQCVAAAKLGSRTAIVAKLGSDKWGKKYKDNLIKENVYIDYVQTVDKESTGIAMINVADTGENQIVIVPGANGTLCAGDVEASTLDILDKARVLIVQLETPLSSTLTALRNFKGISILNAAPALTETSLELFTLPTIFCVNEIETISMTKCSITNIIQAKRSLSHFLCLGCKIVIITLGEEGAIFATSENSEAIHVRPGKIKNVVDTTGAGDAFIGALAHFMAIHPDLSMEQKIAGACAVATMSTQKLGTQISYPSISDLEFDITTHKFDWVTL